jgi:ABC-type polysaccharide/polyol phosphate export permease
VNISRAIAVSQLRLRLNASYFAMQLVIDVGMPIAYAFAAAATLPDVDAGRLAFATLLLSATLSLLRMPTSTLLYERLTGGSKLLAAAGVSRSEYLASNVVTNLYFAILPILSFLICFVALEATQSMHGEAILAMLFYFIFLHGASLLISSIFDSPGAIALVTNLIVLFTAAICPLYFSPDRVPHLLRPLVEVLPASLAMATNDADGGSGLSSILQLRILAFWAVLSTLLGYRFAARNSS